MNADAIVVGAGLAGLVAASELVEAGKRVVLVDQEPEASLGGQAFWSFGGIFLVDSPEQRRMGVKDSYELAWQDWQGTAGFDRPEDLWPARWAEAYVQWAAGEKREWMHARGIRFLPNPGWAERGGYDANGHGNSVPRFHVTWGTGPGVIAPFVQTVRDGVARGLVELRFRHRVDALSVTGGVVDGVAGAVLAPSGVGRGEASSREVVGEFSLSAPGGDRHVRRDRRQPRAGPQGLAGAARHAAGADDLRRPRPRRRADAADQPRTRARARSTPTACGTTSRASTTGTRSGRCTGSGSCPARRRCGSTRRAGACRSRCSRGSTRSGRWSTSRRPATTTRGSC